MADNLLTGRKRIQAFVGRSWQTVLRWIDEEGFPARKLDGIWESDVELVLEWRQKQILKEGKDK